MKKRAIWQKVLFTFLTPKFLWPHVVKDYARLASRAERQKSLFFLKKALHKIFWFWPTLLPAYFWHDRNSGEERGPDCYVAMDEMAHLLMDEVQERVKEKSAAILDLGCNIGRFLNHLDQNGYVNLHGVDINIHAPKLMDAQFNNLSKRAHVTIATMQEYLLNAPSRSFEAVYTSGATVELVHPSFPLIREIARVARRWVIFMISKDGGGYPRFWEYEFAKAGFVLVKLFRKSEWALAGSVALLVFERCPQDASA